VLRHASRSATPVPPTSHATAPELELPPFAAEEAVRIAKAARLATADDGLLRGLTVADAPDAGPIIVIRIESVVIEKRDVASTGPTVTRSRRGSEAAAQTSS
jgi:hypothetical protein